MYAKPMPFGIFIGVVSTIVIEVVILIIAAMSNGSKKQ